MELSELGLMKDVEAAARLSSGRPIRTESVPCRRFIAAGARISGRAEQGARGLLAVTGHLPDH